MKTTTNSRPDKPAPYIEAQSSKSPASHAGGAATTDAGTSSKVRDAIVAERVRIIAHQITDSLDAIIDQPGLTTRTQKQLLIACTMVFDVSTSRFDPVNPTLSEPLLDEILGLLQEAQAGNWAPRRRGPAGNDGSGTCDAEDTDTTVLPQPEGPESRGPKAPTNDEPTKIAKQRSSRRNTPETDQEVEI